MAGIGFELKKLFEKKGILNSCKAYGYATVICSGPMLLGVILLLGIMYLCSIANVSFNQKELLICMITYTLLASVMSTSFFSMIVTRYTADMLYEDKKSAVLPSFWGSSAVMMCVGSVLWLIFLIFSGANLVCAFLMFIFFNEMIIVFNAMSYLSAIKDYKGIFLSYLAAILVTFILGLILILIFKSHIIELLLFSVTCGYGVMVIWNLVLIHRYFPKSNVSAFLFLEWLDEYLYLALSGFFINLGMFAHLVIMWFSKIGVKVHGLFYGAPEHDVPALLAFLTTLITTVNFVVSVEVNFYGKYKNHYSLYNDKGTIKDIKKAEKEMLDTLKTEMLYTSIKQLLLTALFIAAGGYLLDVLPLGLSEMARGYFRTLCVGYGIYAVGNMTMLILLYYTDYKGAFLVTASFALGSVVLSILSLFFSEVYYGFGFLIASAIFLLLGILRLDYFTKRLPYYILATQNLVSEDKSGIFKKMKVFLEDKLDYER